MKFKTFASPSLMCFALFPWGIIVFVIGVLISRQIIPMLIWFGVTYVIVSAISGLLYRNAFAVVHIDETGIKNHNTTLKWEEINSIETEVVELFKYRCFPTFEIDILCICPKCGKVSFFKTNRDCIFIESTEKNRELIEKFWGRSLFKTDK